LPLQKRNKVLVTGFSADSGPNLMGGWTIGWQGAYNPDEQPPAVTVLQGVINKIGNRRVVYAPGVPTSANATDEQIAELREQAVLAAADTDAIIVVAGEPPYAEYLGDTTHMVLASDQQELVAALAATGKPVIVVLVAGRPLIMDQVLENAHSILMAHLPGSQGGNAIADVLFGDYNPSGHLAFSWPRRVGQLPLVYNSVVGAYEGLTGEGETRVDDPLYRFGHGLSYTQFRHGGLAIASRRVSPTGTVTAWVEVDNIGSRAGEDLVELYVRPKWSAVAPNRRQLVAFERVHVQPGQSKTVQLSFPVSRLAVTLGDVLGTGPTVVQPGDYQLFGQDESMLLEFTIQ
jgi:beta-glucosidase